MHVLTTAPLPPPHRYAAELWGGLSGGALAVVEATRTAFDACWVRAMRRLHAAVRIQALFRWKVAHRRVVAEQAARYAAACRKQAAWRGWLGRRIRRRLEAQIRAYVQRIQTFQRMLVVRRYYRVRLPSIRADQMRMRFARACTISAISNVQAALKVEYQRAYSLSMAKRAAEVLAQAAEDVVATESDAHAAALAGAEASAAAIEAANGALAAEREALDAKQRALEQVSLVNCL